MARRGSAGRRRGAGGDVQAAAIETCHGDLESLAFAADQVADRHADVFEVHHGRRLRVPAQLAFLGAEADAGPVFLDHQADDAAMAIFAGADHADVDLVFTAAGDEGLGAVDHVVVAVATGLVFSDAASEPAPGSVRQ